ATRTVVVYGPPAAMTLTASSITSASATLNAAINPNAASTSCYFQYGLTTNYGSFSSTNGLPGTIALILTNRSIAGLSPATLYHFRAFAVNGAGATNGADLTFTTLVAQATSPLTLTGPTVLTNGSFQFAFTNTPGAPFTVLCTTNL